MFIGERRLDWAMNRKQRSERERERERKKTLRILDQQIGQVDVLKSYQT